MTMRQSKLRPLLSPHPHSKLAQIVIRIMLDRVARTPEEVTRHGNSMGYHYTIDQFQAGMKRAIETGKIKWAGNVETMRGRTAMSWQIV